MKNSPGFASSALRGPRNLARGLAMQLRCVFRESRVEAHLTRQRFLRAVLLAKGKEKVRWGLILTRAANRPWGGLDLHRASAEHLRSSDLAVLRLPAVFDCVRSTRRRSECGNHFLSSPEACTRVHESTWITFLVARHRNVSHRVGNHELYRRCYVHGRKRLCATTGCHLSIRASNTCLTHNSENHVPLQSSCCLQDEAVRTTVRRQRFESWRS